MELILEYQVMNNIITCANSQINTIIHEILLWGWEIAQILPPLEPFIFFHLAESNIAMGHVK